MDAGGLYKPVGHRHLQPVADLGTDERSVEGVVVPPPSGDVPVPSSGREGTGHWNVLERGRLDGRCSGSGLAAFSPAGCRQSLVRGRYGTPGRCTACLPAVAAGRRKRRWPAGIPDPGGRGKAPSAARGVTLRGTPPRHGEKTAVGVPVCRYGGAQGAGTGRGGLRAADTSRSSEGRPAAGRQPPGNVLDIRGPLGGPVAREDSSTLPRRGTMAGPGCTPPPWTSPPWEGESGVDSAAPVALWAECAPWPAQAAMPAGTVWAMAGPAELIW